MTKILAHRGANKHAPQNTIPAFLKAIELGADGVENDVHLTKDGELVICHNYTLSLIHICQSLFHCSSHNPEDFTFIYVACLRLYRTASKDARKTFCILEFCAIIGSRKRRFPLGAALCFHLFFHIGVQIVTMSKMKKRTKRILKAIFIPIACITIFFLLNFLLNAAAEPRDHVSPDYAKTDGDTGNRNEDRL